MSGRQEPEPQSANSAGLLHPPDITFLTVQYTTFWVPDTMNLCYSYVASFLHTKYSWCLMMDDWYTQTIVPCTIWPGLPTNNISTHDLSWYSSAVFKVDIPAGSLSVLWSWMSEYCTLSSLEGGITVADRVWGPTSAYINPGEAWEERCIALHTNASLHALSSSANYFSQWKNRLIV